ncbi:type IV secretion system protein [Bartonella sp. B35(2025)]
MKKQIISVMIAVILGASNPAAAISFFGAGATDLNKSVVPSDWFFGKPTKQAKPSSPKKPTSSQNYEQILSLMKQQLEMKKKQFEQDEKIYSSITKNRKFGTIQTDHASFFLKNPQSIYSSNNNSDISTWFRNIQQEEEISDSTRDARDTINQRSQHTAIVDKAISLQTLQETENRFSQITKLLNEIKKTQDLKGIAELQAHIKGKLAMIQNEATKLQMVAHLRNAEHTLISQQKHKRNMKILNNKNTKIPTIRSIR